jgi:hypothetical protein
MSVTDEQQTQLPVQPKGAALIIAIHEYNPANGHYEPAVLNPPSNAIGIGTLSGGPIFLTPANINQRWVYGVIASDGGSGGGVFILMDTLGPTLKFGPQNVASGGVFSLISTPNAPLFTLPPNDGLGIISANPLVVDVLYVDK